MEQNAYVSVPYWGSLSSNLLAKTWERMNIVSVPYWGSLSSNIIRLLQMDLQVKFPSPTGVLYLLIFYFLWKH